ncbi:hypothetical protein ACFLSI_01860 [Bacteroidota bacterium]
MFRTIIIFLLVVVAFSTQVKAQSAYTNNREYYKGLRQRQHNIINELAKQSWKEGDDYRKRIYLGIVKVYSGIDQEEGVKYLWDAVNDSIHWSFFDLYSFMEAIYRIGDKLPPEMIAKAKTRIAENFKEDKGFTENHKLQYRTASYLFAQKWPDGPVFDNGTSPLNAKKEAEEWIYSWINRTLEKGMYEFDSVNYMSLYFLCFTSLVDFSEDPVMRKKAWKMMQLLIADIAAEYLKGNWTGSHSREKFNQVNHTIYNCGTAIPFGYLFFGDSEFYADLPETYYVGLAAIQAFRPLSIIADIATDRSQPYVHKERKSPRKGLGICTLDIPVMKYDYMSRNFALGSSYGDISAVENHRWDLTWHSEKDGSTCFFINPSNSKDRLLEFFDAPPDEIVNAILKQRPYYDDKDKWIEGSTYEKLFQHGNTLIALYDIPENEINTHVNGYFSKIIETRITGKDGWTFCKTDSVYFAIKTFTKGEWIEKSDHYILQLTNIKTGLLFEVAEQSDYSSFKNFQMQVTGNDLYMDLEKMQVIYTNSGGDILDFNYNGKRSVNGIAVDPYSWKLFEGPYINTQNRGKTIHISYNNNNFVLDFSN